MKYLLIICLFTAGIIFPAEATHYRYGNINWQPVQGQQNTIQFKISVAYRRSYFGAPNIGSIISLGTFSFGDNTSTALNVTVTSVDFNEDWFFGEATLTHQYASGGNYLANFTSCCRISSLQNNADGVHEMETIVNVGTNNRSPISTLAPIVNLPSGDANVKITLPAFDPDGDKLSFRLANGSEVANGGAFSNPPGFSINSNTGVISWKTTGLSDDELWNAAVVIEDGNSKITVDFILKIFGTTPTSPPQFDYTKMPANGTVFQIPPGQKLEFDVYAKDPDGQENIILNAVSLPPGATMTPTLPTSGNPVKSTFSWTPTNSELGTNVINFSVTDPTGTQVFTSVTVEVSLRPSFAGNTPGDGSTFCVKPGDMIEEMISAEDPDPKDIVTLSVANLPKNATFPIPPASNPVKSTFSWTPVASDWGNYEIIFTAEDGFGDKANLSLFYSVNQEPVFSSNPVVEAIVGQPYEYKIEVDDPDIQYGDMIELIEEVDPLPAWLSLDYTPGENMATLKGTPQKGDIGTVNISLTAEDKNHHYRNAHCSHAVQTFVLQIKEQGTSNDPSILDISASTPSSCDPKNNMYSVDITVTYDNPPAQGKLIVNNQEFALGTSPQLVTLTKLVSDGQPVDVIAYFSSITNISLEKKGLFVAPQPCSQFKFPITASDGAQNDYFGFSVDISGDWAIAGAYQDDDHGKSSGSAYIYKFDGTAWVENAKLTASDGYTFDRFGIAVAIDGKWAVVGAYQDDDDGTSSGSAYVFEYAGGTWTEKTKLTASDAMPKDRFGWSVDISGNMIIVGAPDDDTYFTNAGSAYIFEYKSGNWMETGKLMPTDNRTGDHFGRSVALDKNQAIVGAYKDNVKMVGHQAGSAYIFQYDGTKWTQQIKLAASDAAAVDRFGVSVDIFDDRAIVGANLDDDGGDASGSAYIFHYTGGKWMQKAKLVASDGMEKDRFSVSVAIEGDKAVIGTPYDDMPGINSGAAYVYEYDGSAWSESMKLKPDDIRTGDYFGWSASISGENTMIGAYRSDKKGKESGSACIYNLASGSDMLARTVNKTDEKSTGLALEEESNAFEEQGPVTISAYPNPVIQKLNIQFNKSVEKPVSFRLYDQLGRLLYSENEIVIDNPQTIEVNLSELKITPGLLFLRVHAEGEKERTVRVLKQ